MKTLTLIVLVFFSSETFSKIRLVNDTLDLHPTPQNIDIDQDGIWDAKMKYENYEILSIQLAYKDASNYTAIRLISDSEPNPVPFPLNADIKAVGKWVYSINQAYFVVNNFAGSNPKYIGILLVKNGIQYCSWIKMVTFGSSFLKVGATAWEDDKTQCMLAGQTISASIKITPNIEISINPSPANDFISIQGNQSAIDISIFNSLGENILTFNRVNSNAPLDIRSLPTGIYYIYIQENNIGIRKKLIISR